MELEPNTQNTEEKTGGAVFGSIAIILILIIGGIYLVREKIKETKALKLQQEQLLQQQLQNQIEDTQKLTE